MNNHFLREGFSSYYVVKREKEHSYEEKILTDQKCRSVLPFEIRRVDHESYYYFNVSGYCSLKQKMGDKQNSIKEYREMYRKLLESIAEVEEYLLPPEGILMESENIFFKDGDQGICFCYLPGRHKDLMQQLMNLTEEFLEMINYEDRSLVEYLYHIHEMVSKGKLPDFAEQDEMLEESEEKILYLKESEDGEVWEYEEEDIPFFRNRPEVKRSGKWYMEIGILAAVSAVLAFMTGYQLYAAYEFGWNAERGKIIVILTAGFIGNLLYLLKKIKIRSTPEKFTTILTEEESIDKIK